MADAASLQSAMFEAVRTRDFTRLRELYHPGYVYMSGDGVEQIGPDCGVAVAESYTTAFPDLSFEVRGQYAPSADVAIMEFTGVGTHEGPLGDIPPTGKRVRVLACNVVEARDGRIFREREYYDSLDVMQQLGVVIAADRRS
jgi:steroid delta-isomerase-like uncharacterized protein